MELDLSIKKKYSDFNLDIKFKTNASILGIIGESGAGKSMTLKLLSGIIKPDKGKIKFNDIIFFDSNKKINLSIIKRKIGYVFQEYALFPQMTVKNNIIFGLHKEIKEVIEYKAKKIIKKMHLIGLENRFPYQLSNGQRQRVALGRALILQPQLLLLDEPFSALDSHLRFELIEYLREDLKKFKGQTVFVTHNIREAYRLCNEIIIINKGTIEEKGNKNFIFKYPSNKKTLELTGCKNISKAKKNSNNTILAIDWGVIFKTKKIINKNITYLGIRDSFFKITKEKNMDNCLKFNIINYIKNPNSISLYCKFIENNEKLLKYHFHWEVSNFYFEKINKKKLPLKVYFDSNNLIII